jgi:NADH-quinone oxidoreductase subunit I
MLGLGVLKSMAVTFWNFVLSYVYPKKGIFTVQYPEERKEVEERFRNFPFLIYDGTPDNLRCVSCDICAKECPPKCIYIVPEKDEQGRILKRPAQFDIDFAICMNCGICEEVCPFDAIYMDHEYELSEYNREQNLMYAKERLLKPAEHFARIRPHDFAEVEAKRAAKAGGKGRATPTATATAAPAPSPGPTAQPAQAPVPPQTLKTPQPPSSPT